MIPGYIQQVPIFQAPEHNQKRGGSPLSGLGNENVEKRTRQGSGEMSSILDSPGQDEPDAYTLRDIMTELKKLATKEDLVQVKGTIVAQSAEIQQLRSEIEKHSDRIKTLETEAGARAAKEANSTNRPDVYNLQRKQYGSAQSERPPWHQQRRQSIVIHGLKVKNDDELLENILDLCQAMDVIAFSSDVEEITRLGRTDNTGTRTPPIRVVFQFAYIRNNILQRKSNLLKHQKYSSVFINADEPIEIRRRKGLFRKIAQKAREDGKSATYRADWIQIDEDVYQASELQKIPRKYMPEDTRRPEARQSLETRRQANKDDNTGAGAATATLLLSPEPNVKIKMTKSGLTFSGPTAYLSNMSKSDFVYKGLPYTSSEQGLQHQNALHHKVTDIAAKIMNTTSTKEIKTISHDIPKSDEWVRISPGILWDMTDCKYTQNPELMAKLLKTAPHRLIEASFDSHWGGGPLWSRYL